MELIIFENNLYHLIQVTKDMLQGIIIPAGSDCIDICNIIRDKFTVYNDSKNQHILNGHNALFYGCICR